MKKILTRIIIWIIIPIITTLLMGLCLYNLISIDSSLVEDISNIEIYNNHIEEVTDSDDVTVLHDSIGHIIMPDE